MRRIAVLLFSLVLISCSARQEFESEAEKEIRMAMDIQVTSWNNANMAGYMKYYWRSPELTFHSGARLLLGWDTLDSMYRTKYSGPARGILRFNDTVVSVLSRDSAYVTGQWQVQFPDTLKEGRFTLIFRWFDEGWRIVHDHSS